MKFLEDEHLRLRALEPEDIDCLYRWENDSSLWEQGVTLTPYSRYSLKQYIAEAQYDIFTNRQLRLMIEIKASHTVIGTLDLYDFDPMNARAGVGILIDEAYRRQAWAFKSLQIVKQYAFEFLSLHQLFAYVGETNLASLALFSKLGYIQAGTLKDWTKQGASWQDVCVLQLLNK